MDGKKGTAPCGHEGEHVIGNYVRCLSGCDDKKPPKPMYIVSDDVWNWSPLSRAIVRCPKCGKDDNPTNGPVLYGKASQLWYCLQSLGGCGNIWS